MTRVSELTTQLLDGTLTDAECAELASMIATDPVAESEHLAILELEAELRGLRTEFDLSEATLEQVLAVQTERTADAVLAEIESGPAPAWAKSPTPTQQAETQQRRRLWLGTGVLVACAAAILLGLWLGIRQPTESSPDGSPAPAQLAFAKLARKSGAVELLNPAGDAINAEEGGELPAWFTVRTVGDDSHAVVELLRDQTRVEIESDSVVRFTGDTPETIGQPRMFLATGQLTAAVPERPDDRPLVVATSVTAIFARGGTFVLSSAGPDSARVDNKQGKVDLVRALTKKPVPVGVGGTAVIRAGFEKVDFERTLTVDRTPKRTLAAPNTRDAMFSPDGSEVWVASARHFARWSAEGGLKEVAFYPRKSGDGVAAFTRDKRFLVGFRAGDDRALVRSLPDGGEHAAINARPHETRFWAVAADGSWLAAADPKPQHKRVRLFDGSTGDERFAREFEELVGCIAAAPDGATLAVGLNDMGRGINNKVVILDAKSGDRLFALATQKKALTAMTFSVDGRLLAVGFNGTVQLWDVRSRELRSITGFERALTCLTFSPDGKRLAAGTQDGHVWVWDAATGQQTQLIAVGGRVVRSVAFSPNGKQLVTVANAAPVTVWDVTDIVPSPAVQ